MAEQPTQKPQTTVEQPITNAAYIENLLNGLQPDLVKFLETHPYLKDGLANLLLAISQNAANIDAVPQTAALSLADWEALVAGATICFNNPEITRPTVKPGDTKGVGLLARFLEIAYRNIGSVIPGVSRVSTIGGKTIRVTHTGK